MDHNQWILHFACINCCEFSSIYTSSFLSSYAEDKSTRRACKQFHIIPAAHPYHGGGRTNSERVLQGTVCTSRPATDVIAASIRASSDVGVCTSSASAIFHTTVFGSLKSRQGACFTALAGMYVGGPDAT